MIRRYGTRVIDATAEAILIITGLVLAPVSAVIAMAAGAVPPVSIVVAAGAVVMMLLGLGSLVARFSKAQP